MFSIDTEKEITTYGLVIRNFLNYVLQHAVCPEYTQDIMAARKICDLAVKELWAIKQLQKKLPGDFNVAASILYGGRYEGIHISNQAWAKEDPDYEEYLTVNQGFSNAEAERIFKTALAYAGTDDMFLAHMKPDVSIVKTERKFYEIVAIRHPDEETVKDYKNVKNLQGEPGYIKALGVLKLKAWEGPGLDEEDCTDDEGTPAAKAEDSKPQGLWLEDEILELCYPGLKLELIVHELSSGVKFFDAVMGLHCSFHTFLPNEKMLHWKDPGKFFSQKIEGEMRLTIRSTQHSTTSNR